MKRKWLTSDEMRHATHKPGECWENIAKFGNTPRWIVTTWAAVQAKADAEDPPRSTPEVPPKLPRGLPHNHPPANQAAIHRLHPRGRYKACAERYRAP